MAVLYEARSFLQLYTDMQQFLIGANSTLNNFNTATRLNTLIEAVAFLASKVQNDIYTGLKKAIPVAVYDGFNFDLLPGIQASGKMTFSRSSAALQDYTIPVGSTILLNGIRFTTIVEGTILTGDTSSEEILSQCTVVGVDGNIAIGAIDTLLGQGSFVNQPNGAESCKNFTAFTSGENAETETERTLRFQKYINSLARSTLAGIESAVESVAGVNSYTIRENFPSDGWITIYADDGTGTLSPALQAELLKVINGDETDPVNYPGYRATGIYIQVLEPTVQLVDFECEIFVPSLSLLTDGEIETQAVTAIQQYVNKLKLGNDVILAEVVSAVMVSNEEFYDFVITVPAANVVIASNTLAKTNTIDITVTRF